MKTADAIACLRMLALDMVGNAGSGHTGAPLGMADIFTVLAQKLNVDPQHPGWINRDRLVLSNGHAVAVHYASLHLMGYDVPMAQLKNLRTLHSITPGHPEYGLTPGVDCTTGPLGQGIASAVGMALAEKILNARYRDDRGGVVDHATWAIVGEGCLMEGVSYEACSFAGLHKLGKLNVIYDRNLVTIDNPSQATLGEDIAQRFASFGWHVIDDVDGHDAAALEAAMDQALGVDSAPSLIIADTKIGWGGTAEFEGQPAAHGFMPWEANRKLLADKLDWSHEPFTVPQSSAEAWSKQKSGAENYARWEERLGEYASLQPELHGELVARIDETSAVPDLVSASAEWKSGSATRGYIGAGLRHIQEARSDVIGGSADLGSSTQALHGDSRILGQSADGDASYIAYGVREHAMGSITNGVAYHGGFRPFAGTFLVFLDYMRPPVRLSALSELSPIWIYTHDSIAVGADGPTHQPIEHLASLHAVPHLEVWRPASAVETAVAWEEALARKSAPTVLIGSRQGVAEFTRPSDDVVQQLRTKGAYIAHREQATHQWTLITQGAEVALCIEVAQQLSELGVRVVSVPCWDRFRDGGAAYQSEIAGVPVAQRLLVLTAAPGCMATIAGHHHVMTSFGASGATSDVLEHFGFTPNAIIEKLQNLSARP